MTYPPGFPSCDPHGNPPIFGDCWYNCTSEDISGEDKKHRLRKVNYFLPFRFCFKFTWMIIFFSVRKLLGGVSVMLCLFEKCCFEGLS